MNIALVATAQQQARKKAWRTPVIHALTESVKHCDIRVHDAQVVAKNVEIVQVCTTKMIKVLGKKKTIKSCYTTSTTVTRQTCSTTLTNQ
ncbi:MAG TPA: hypothetical protein QF700_11130 [Prochlorococcus sp.]|nr:hypothetical protein [Prochlorococcus sp.]